MSTDTKAVILIIISTIGLLIAIRGLYLSLKPTITVHVEGREVFRGNAGCVDIESAGAATKVKTAGGFLCLFPRAQYVSSDVVSK